MGLSLTSDRLLQLEEASRVLLSPLLATDTDAWRTEVMRVTRRLMGADHAMFAHSGMERSHLGETPDDPVAAAYERLIATSAGEFENRVDPMSSVWMRRFRARGFGVLVEAEIQREMEAEGYRWQDSATMREVMWGNGLYSLRGFVGRHGRTEGALQFTNLKPGLDGAGEEARPLLGALYPSFLAGLDALGRLAAHRAALEAFDAVADGLVVLDADGRERYRNRALLALIDADPERGLVEGALWQLGRDLRRLAFPRRTEAGPALAPMQRTVATARARYTLSATLVASGAFGVTDSALVTVATDVAPRPPTVEEVRARLGLTVREAEVALLVAEGLSNREVADRLFVAPGTVKRHLEGVFAKLGVSTRAAVAARLLQPGAPA